MSDQTQEIIRPEELDNQLSEDLNVGEKISQVSEALITLIKDIGNRDDITKVSNIVLTLISQEEIYNRLFAMYEAIYGIRQRLHSLRQLEEYHPEDQAQFQKRAAEIIRQNIFLAQREVFFKIVNAKEVAEGERNEDGPALLFPGIEKSKTAILKEIQSKNQQLRPVAIDICKSFQGIADKYIETEQFKPGEKPSYDTISQSYERERSIRSDILGNISLSSIDDVTYLNTLINAFEQLKKTYRLKIKALSDKESENVVNFEQKVKVLKDGQDMVDKRLKPLQVLKGLIIRFPQLEKQLDFFAESHYQAKAVMKFLEEVNLEMAHVFKQYSLESFTVVSFLRYKLNCTSHMYQSIYYYYAVVQIETDMERALKRRHKTSSGQTSGDTVEKELFDTGIPAIVRKIHEAVSRMNEGTYEIHMAFLDYKVSPQLDSLRKSLVLQTEKINSLHKKVMLLYKKARQLFLKFLADDLGSTRLIDQFVNYLKVYRELPEANDIRKAFTKLLATRQKDLAILEKELSKRYGEKLDADKISAMAQLKIRQDFQNDLINEIQEHPRAQDMFLHIIREFIKTQDEQDASHKSDNTIIWTIHRDFPNELLQFKVHEAGLFKKILRNPNLSERDLAICFLAANITPQEIESFSRILPALPRNEFQLDSPFGRMLLDIKTMHKERLQLRGGSVSHLTEKIYEKREHMKLVNSICLFLKVCTDPFYKKVDAEESKVNQLINLQKRKYRKELNEVIRYWQYLVQEQFSPGQGVRGRFRSYKPSEKDLMSKYISPEQLDTIERQLESSYDLDPESKLFEVECFLMEIAEGLFANFKEDLHIKAVFENHEKSKKIKKNYIQQDEFENILDSESFVPHIRKCLSRVKRISRQETISDFIDFWEYLIDQHVPSSEKRKKKEVPKVVLKNDSDNAVHYISTEQITQLVDNINLIRTIRDEDKKQKLLKAGLPLMQIAQQSFIIFDTSQAKLILQEVEKERKAKMLEFCKNDQIKKRIDESIEYVK